jgi:hypothetical protein
MPYVEVTVVLEAAKAFGSGGHLPANAFRLAQHISASYE